MVNQHVLPPAGVSCALITPVTADGALDLGALDRLVERAVAGGVHGLSPTGSTGEGSRLTVSQRQQVVARVCAAAQGLPVIAGVPPQAVDDLLRELDVAASAGARAGLVAPPGFYAASDAEVLDFYRRLAERTPLPLVLYHIPALAGAGVSPQVAAELATHPAVVGLKDSSRDLKYLRALVHSVSDAAVSGTGFTVVTGTDALLVESLETGAVGAIAASPNVVPDLAVRIWERWVDGDRYGAQLIQRDLGRVVEACRAGGFPAGWKYAAAGTGACEPFAVPPGGSVPPRAKAAIDGVLAAVGTGG